jgi:mannosyl-3-phosphoglycerate phosphatase
MIVIFTDLDGTLLDQHSYSFGPAEDALAELRTRDLPLILCTSKSRAETEVWRSKLDNSDPFVVENGGAAFIPDGYFGPYSAELRDGYEVLELGTPYSSLVRTLRECSIESGITVRGFHDMSAAEVAVDSGLTIVQAELAKKREYDEPFVILHAGSPEPLLQAIASRGCRCTRGGRYFHITGANDKAAAVAHLLERFRRNGNRVVSAGLGDGLNDAEFLNAVDVPILMPSAYIEELQKAVPRGRVASAAGPTGWNAAILEVISKVLPQ